MFETTVEKLVVSLETICSHICLIEDNREIDISYLQVWECAKFQFNLSKKEVNKYFVAAVEEYSTLILTYHSERKKSKVSIDVVENIVTDDKALSAKITHTKEYFDYLVNSQIHGNI